jgi:hypothetical protein
LEDERRKIDNSKSNQLRLGLVHSRPETDVAVGLGISISMMIDNTDGRSPCLGWR